MLFLFYHSSFDFYRLFFIGPLTKADGGKSDELTVENISDFFFNILNSVVQIQDISGSVTFDDLKKSYE